MKKKIIFFIWLCSSILHGAHAQTVSTQDLMDTCSDEQKGSAKRGFCLGYIVGFRSTYQWVYLQETKSLNGELTICIPDEVTNGQLQAIFNKRIKKEPEIWHYPHVVGFYEVMQRAYPCK